MVLKSVWFGKAYSWLDILTLVSTLLQKGYEAAWPKDPFRIELTSLMQSIAG